ncbi:hypothetical protein MASSI9I_50861 [Massilia sp. 9I]|nr:hypothetical protein MASSI9I_50861 [Massilia sp. 9I]
MIVINPLMGKEICWRRGRESNPSRRLCRPLHNRFATSPDFILAELTRPVMCRINREVNVFSKFGAGEESRTLDLNLGKVALYQLSYSRIGVQRVVKPLEREKSLELSTSTLARLRSTN